MRVLGQVLAACFVLVVCVFQMAVEADRQLIDAVKERNRPAVEALLRAQTPVNTPEADGTTALHWAVRGADHELVQVLLKAGADVKAANRYGVTPLALAATNGDARTADALLAAGADPNAVQGEGETVLMTAARTGSVPVVRALLDRGAVIEARDGWLGQTALMWAAAENHADVVRLLAQRGANLNVTSAMLEFPRFTYNVNTMVNTPLPRGGMTALLLAARENALDAVRALVEAGADLDISDPDGTSPLVMAIINRHNDVAAYLLEQGADPNVSDAVGMAALYAAVDLRFLAGLINRPTPKPTSTLDNMVLVERLLAKGANPNARLRLPLLPRFHNRGDIALGEGATPLMRAVRGGDVALMRLLLDKGANPNLTTTNYMTALMFSMAGGGRGGRGRGAGGGSALEAVQLLVARGADVNAFNRDGQTPLHVAAARGDRELVEFLVERGARRDIRDRQGRTSVDIAAGAKGQPALLQSLTRPDAGSSTSQPGVPRSQMTALPARHDDNATRIWAGAYTPEQIEMGQAAYTRACRRCHEPDLGGRAGTAPPLRGEPFIEEWEGQDVKRLIDRIRNSMPPDHPNGMIDDDYLGLGALLLQANGYPAGTARLEMQNADQVVILRDPREAPRAPRNFAIVRAVGCLVPGAGGAWRLVDASHPMLTRDRPATLQELTDAAGEPAGSHAFELQSAAAFDPESHAGRRVEARGLLYHSPEGSRLSLSSMQPLAAVCQR